MSHSNWTCAVLLNLAHRQLNAETIFHSLNNAMVSPEWVLVASPVNIFAGIASLVPNYGSPDNK